MNYKNLVTSYVKRKVCRKIYNKKKVKEKDLKNNLSNYFYNNSNLGVDHDKNLNYLIYNFYWLHFIKRRKIDLELVSSKNFYNLQEWKNLRQRVLTMYGNTCMKCGDNNKNQAPHCDHIVPRSKRPDLALDINNLQILCSRCNLDKSNKNCKDYRKLSTGLDFKPLNK